MKRFADRVCALEFRIAVMPHAPSPQPSTPPGSHQGEGTRGGKVVGHTKSGDPIYQGHAYEINAHHPIFQGEQGKALKNKIDLGGDHTGKTLVYHGGDQTHVHVGSDDWESATHQIPHDALLKHHKI